MHAITILCLIFSLVSIALLITIIVTINQGSNASLRNIDDLDSSEMFHYDPTPPPIVSPETRTFSGYYSS